MSAIKKFFEKRKLDIKFKKAGSGHTLSESKPRQSDSHRPGTSGASNQPRGPPSDAAQRAREAALARTAQPRPGSAKQNSVKAKVMREMEAERKAQELAAAASANAHQGPLESFHEHAPVLSKTGVFFKCPLVTNYILSKQDMEQKIEEFLLSQLAEEPQMASALMIYTLNKNPEKVNVCIETLCKYLDNLIANPDEEKFRKIRLSNKAFKERVSALKGTDEFLQSVGFSRQLLPFQEVEEEFYVIDEENAKNTDRLQDIKDVLHAAEPIKPELSRDLRVFHQSSNASHFELGNDFYNITPEELKREQQTRQEAAEKLGMLRTKAMRERDEQRELRRYRYTLLRIRMPNGIILQATFKALEKLACVFEFVRENLIDGWMPFTLATATGQKLTTEDATLAELGLAPAAVLNFAWDPAVLAEVTAQKGSHQTGDILLPDIMAQIQTLKL